MVGGPVWTTTSRGGAACVVFLTVRMLEVMSLACELCSLAQKNMDEFLKGTEAFSFEALVDAAFNDGEAPSSRPAKLKQKSTKKKKRKPRRKSRNKARQ